MSGYYNRAIERDRKETMTKEKILRIAKKQGSFRVSLRYRDDWLRARCGQLKGAGLLVGGRRDGRHVVYYPAATPRAATTPTPAEPADGSAAQAAGQALREAKSPLHAEAETAGGER